VARPRGGATDGKCIGESQGARTGGA
jgi:hypothetical protein